MDEILKLARYATLHYSIIDNKYDLSILVFNEFGIKAQQDMQKLMNICIALDKEINKYLGVN